MSVASHREQHSQLADLQGSPCCSCMQEDPANAPMDRLRRVCIMLDHSGLLEGTDVTPLGFAALLAGLQGGLLRLIADWVVGITSRLENFKVGLPSCLAPPGSLPWYPPPWRGVAHCLRCAPSRDLEGKLHSEVLHDASCVDHNCTDHFMPLPAGYAMI
jgi:hypothetical protein